MNSYDKLKPYGICVNGSIDGFPRKINRFNDYTTSRETEEGRERETIQNTATSRLYIEMPDGNLAYYTQNHRKSGFVFFLIN